MEEWEPSFDNPRPAPDAHLYTVEREEAEIDESARIMRVELAILLQDKEVNDYYYFQRDEAIERHEERVIEIRTKFYIRRTGLPF